MKIVINKCWGGFGLSQEAWKRLIELGVPVYDIDNNNVEDTFVVFRNEDGEFWNTWRGEERANPLLVQVVEELGEKADGDHAALKVVEIPEGVDWLIDDYDGKEHIEERHRVWY
jgi:hypothetical protein